MLLGSLETGPPA